MRKPKRKERKQVALGNLEPLSKDLIIGKSGTFHSKQNSLLLFHPKQEVNISLEKFTSLQKNSRKGRKTHKNLNL